MFVELKLKHNRCDCSTENLTDIDVLTYIDCDAGQTPPQLKLKYQTLSERSEETEHKKNTKARLILFSYTYPKEVGKQTILIQYSGPAKRVKTGQIEPVHAVRQNGKPIRLQGNNRNELMLRRRSALRRWETATVQLNNAGCARTPTHTRLDTV